MQRQLRHLVEEQRAAFRALEKAGFVGDRAGKRPFLVPEELALHQLARYRAAIDRHERTVTPRPGIVDHDRDQFLAGPRLAANVDRRLAAGDLGNQVAHRLHGHGVADQVGVGVFIAGRSVAAQAQRRFYHFAQAIEVQRLRYEIECARLERPDRGLDIAVRRDYRHRRIRRLFLHPFDQVQAAAVG